MTRLSLPILRPIDDTGDVYPGGTLTFYDVGASSTPKVVYSDSALSVSLGSVVTADAGGLFVDIYYSGEIRFVLADSNGVIQLLRDIYDVGSVNTADIVNLAVTTGKIADNAVTLGKLLVLDDAKIITSNGAANSQVSLSGKVTMTNTGVTSVVSASESVTGIVELATAAETITGTSTVLATHPAGVKSATETYGRQILHVQHQELVNVAGGTFTSGAWQTRELNTTVSNAITGASLAANQVTLPAGTYYVNGYASAYNVDGHKTQLYNVTGAANLLLGTTASAFTGVQNLSHVTGIITLAGVTVIELRHRCTNTTATNGFGVAANLVDAEVYADLVFTKL